MSASLSPAERRLLLQLSRQALDAAAEGVPFPSVDQAGLTPGLLHPAACFITLTQASALRGCMGGLKAERALYEEVRERTAQSALQDFRFPPVSPAELPGIEIEISVLSPLSPLDYASTDVLPHLLHPRQHGVVLAKGFRRATFLPQVWDRVPEPDQFLSMLCEKMGLPPDTWRRTRLEVFTYQVEKFTEAEVGGLSPPSYR